jgi:hypothetical protein
MLKAIVETSPDQRFRTGPDSGAFTGEYNANGNHDRIRQTGSAQACTEEAADSGHL